MAEKFRLKIAMPSGQFYDNEVNMVELTTTEGRIGIYGGHFPLAAMAAPGVLRIHENGMVKEAALHSGFIEILPERVTILAEDLEWPGEIDRSRAEEAKKRAESRIKSSSSELDIMRAELALKRSLVRLEIKEK